MDSKAEFTNIVSSVISPHIQAKKLTFRNNQMLRSIHFELFSQFQSAVTMEAVPVIGDEALEVLHEKDFRH